MKKKLKLQLPHTGCKLIDVIVVLIIVLCALAIVSYAYNFIASLIKVKFASMFMCVIFGMLFFSIIQYAVKFFIQNKRGTIAPMMSSFSTSVLMSTITIQGLENNLFITALLIVMLIPLMSNDLTFTKRCMTVIVVVFILCIVWTVFKLDNLSSLFAGSNPIETMYIWFDAFRTLLVWIFISALFIMRYYLVKMRYQHEIDEVGYDAFMDSYRKRMEEIAIEEAIANIKEQSKKNEEIRNKTSL